MAMVPAQVEAGTRPGARARDHLRRRLPLRPGDYGIERVNGMGWLVRALKPTKRRSASAAPRPRKKRSSSSA